MIDPKVSILMPAYNAARYIDEAIQSVINGSFADWELLVIDDGSIDATTSRVLSYQDCRIHLIKNSHNKGLSGTLNIGIKQARGVYIARLDSDDINLQDRLAVQLAKAESTHADVVISRFIDFSEKDPQGKVRPVMSPVSLFCDLIYFNPIAHSTAFIRRSWLQKVGGYNERYSFAEDYALWVTAVQSDASFHYLRKPLVRIRKHAQSMTAKKNERTAGQYQEISLNYLEFLFRQSQRILQAEERDIWAEWLIQGSLKDFSAWNSLLGIFYTAATACRYPYWKKIMAFICFAIRTLAHVGKARFEY